MLPREAFTGEKRDEPLDKLTRKFLRQRRNLTIDNRVSIPRL
jgi:hypothetical protein